MVYGLLGLAIPGMQDFTAIILARILFNEMSGEDGVGAKGESQLVEIESAYGEDLSNLYSIYLSPQWPSKAVLSANDSLRAKALAIDQSLKINGVAARTPVNCELRLSSL